VFSGILKIRVGRENSPIPLKAGNDLAKRNDLDLKPEV